MSRGADQGPDVAPTDDWMALGEPAAATIDDPPHQGASGGPLPSRQGEPFGHPTGQTIAIFLMAPS